MASYKRHTHYCGSLPLEAGAEASGTFCSSNWQSSLLESPAFGRTKRKSSWQTKLWMLWSVQGQKRIQMKRAMRQVRCNEYNFLVVPCQQVILYYLSNVASYNTTLESRMLFPLKTKTRENEKEMRTWIDYEGLFIYSDPVLRRCFLELGMTLHMGREDS